MNYIYNTLLIGLIACLFSCSTEEDKPLVVTTSDYTVLIDNTVNAEDTIGTVPGTSNRGSVTYAIVSQSIPNALSIGTTSGELIVQDASVFDFKVNPEISLVVSVSKEGIRKISNVIITLEEPCPKVNVDNWLGDIAAENNDEKTPAIGVKNECSIITLQGGNIAGLICDLEVEITIKYEDSDSDSDIGDVIVEKQTYDCITGSNFEIEAIGTYNLETGVTTLDYTLYEDDVETETGITTLAAKVEECESVIDTALWNGNLAIKVIDGDFEDNVTAKGVSACDKLTIDGDVLNIGCDLTPGITIDFSATSVGATTGTAVIERQAYNCFEGENFEIEGAGTYDEDTKTINIAFTYYEEGEIGFTGDLIITVN